MHKSDTLKRNPVVLGRNNKEVNELCNNIRCIQFDTFSIKGMDSEPHKTPYVYMYVKYHHKFIPGTRECISGLLRKIFVFKVGKPSFFPASE